MCLSSFIRWLNVGLIDFVLTCGVNTNLNTSRPSEHPPVRGGNAKTFTRVVGGVIGCKDKASLFWHLIEFPDDSNIGSIV